jgi:hypothetical protein
VRLIAAERLYLWLIVLAPFILGYFVRLSQTNQGLNVAGPLARALRRRCSS